MCNVLSIKQRIEKKCIGRKTWTKQWGGWNPIQGSKPRHLVVRNKRPFPSVTQTKNNSNQELQTRGGMLNDGCLASEKNPGEHHLDVGSDRLQKGKSWRRLLFSCVLVSASALQSPQNSRRRSRTRFPSYPFIKCNFCLLLPTVPCWVSCFRPEV